MVRFALSTLLKSALAVLFLSSGTALAERRIERDSDNRSSGHAYAYGHDKPEHSRGTSSARSVPEFDPAAMGVIGALVAGGGVLLARRRRR